MVHTHTQSMSPLPLLLDTTETHKHTHTHTQNKKAFSRMKKIYDQYSSDCNILMDVVVDQDYLSISYMFSLNIFEEPIKLTLVHVNLHDI